MALTFYNLHFDTLSVPLSEGPAGLNTEIELTDYLDSHRLSKAPMAFPQINLLINTLDPEGCKSMSWTNHLKVLLANRFSIQTKKNNQVKFLEKSYFPAQYKIQKDDLSFLHLGLFYRLLDQTVDDQFSTYCEAASYPEGMMRYIVLEHLKSGHSIWGFDDTSSKLIIGYNELNDLVASEKTIQYFNFESMRKAY